jgi:hypothetical protein
MKIKGLTGGLSDALLEALKLKEPSQKMQISQFLYRVFLSKPRVPNGLMNQLFNALTDVGFKISNFNLLKFSMLSILTQM